MDNQAKLLKELRKKFKHSRFEITPDGLISIDSVRTSYKADFIANEIYKGSDPKERTLFFDLIREEIEKNARYSGNKE